MKKTRGQKSRATVPLSTSFPLYYYWPTFSSLISTCFSLVHNLPVFPSNSTYLASICHYLYISLYHYLTVFPGSTKPPIQSPPSLLAYLSLNHNLPVFPHIITYLPVFLSIFCRSFPLSLVNYLSFPLLYHYHMFHS
jgi:hypothetical protein